MFNGHGVLDLTGDHLDLSYRDPARWPDLTLKGSIKSFVFDIGDPVAGPSVQLGLISRVEDEPLDWAHSIDPVHHHGSDQFRVVAAGEWTLAGRAMSGGGFAFQEAGWIYQEHPGERHVAWLALVMGDRRGGGMTLKRSRDLDTLMPNAELYGAPGAVDEPYAHPAGPAGVAAISTSGGPCERGYLFGRFDDLAHGSATGSLTGVFGDPTAGPVAHILRSAPGAVVIPACSFGAELFLIVVGGSCQVGAKTCRAGDMRIQAAGTRFGPVVSGDAGVELVLVVADRRARAELASHDLAPTWMSNLDQVLAHLHPTPGGARAARERAQVTSKP